MYIFSLIITSVLIYESNILGNSKFIYLGDLSSSVDLLGSLDDRPNELVATC